MFYLVEMCIKNMREWKKKKESLEKIESYTRERDTKQTQPHSSQKQRAFSFKNRKWKMKEKTWWDYHHAQPPCHHAYF